MTTMLPPTFVVGLSVSKPDGEVSAEGIGPIHVRHAFVELVRHVLSAGGTVAYGGDLRDAGYAEQLFELVRTYAWPDKPGAERVRSHLAWHLAEQDKADRARWKAVATFVTAPRPDGDDGPPPVAAGSAADRWRSYLALRAMREQVASEASVQVLLGGRRSGQTGCVPGVIEEAALAVRAGNPIYPVAGFGGAVRAVVDAMQGVTPPELTLEHQLEHGDQAFRDMVTTIGEPTAAERLTECRELLASVAWPDLRNGLSPEQNETLASSRDISEVVALLLRGMAGLSRRS